MKIIVDTLPTDKEDCIFSAPLFATSERFCTLARKVCNLHKDFNETECNGFSRENTRDSRESHEKEDEPQTERSK